MVLRQNQVTTKMCQKLQLKNGSLRYSSQTFDLPASDSGLRMSSSRIAPPPPPATVIVSIINNDMFRSGNGLRECINRSLDLVIKIKKAKISDGRVWAIELHTTGAVIRSLWKSDESAQYSGVCLFSVFVVSSYRDNLYANQEAPITTRYLQSSASSSNLSHLGMASVADPRR